MVDRSILSKLLEVDDLPTLPDVMGLILEIVDDDNSSANELTDVLERDHAISARVLRLANSAFYGLRHEVESIRRAVVVIGFDAVRELALATSVFDAFSRHKQFALDPEDFWLHSLGAAKAAQTLASKYRRDANTGACFTSGLLHDVGKFLLALVLKDDYKDIADLARLSNRPLRDVEQEIISTTHAEVGYWVSDKWHFPKLMAEVIQNQYKLKAYKGPFRDEVAIVSLADYLSREAGFGRAGDPESDDAMLVPAKTALDLNADQLEEVLEGLREQTPYARQFLGILNDSG